MAGVRQTETPEEMQASLWEAGIRIRDGDEDSRAKASGAAGVTAQQAARAFWERRRTPGLA